MMLESALSQLNTLPSPFFDKPDLLVECGFVGAFVEPSNDPLTSVHESVRLGP